MRINLANQVSFLNRSLVEKTFDNISPNKTVILDASGANYIDADVLRVINDFVKEKAKQKNINLSLVGFKEKFGIENQIRYQIHADLELQRALTPDKILQAMKDGNKRFREGKRLPRDLNRQLLATSKGQYPLAVTLSCIDSRTPAELVFDLGIGDIFSIRLAGNVVSERVLGSLEFACSIAGAKLIVVMGHTKCGAVSAAIQLHNAGKSARDTYGCEHLDHLMSDIQKSMNFSRFKKEFTAYDNYKEEIEVIAVKANVLQSIDIIKTESKVINRLLADNKIKLVGCVYDVNCGKVEFV
ncbi:MAG: Carbonic anhydrase 2 [bacterium ADurb.BinA186]|nr:MAG: Carbonic anhydrase 2 [bacterium ADurb.BinA186]